MQSHGNFDGVTKVKSIHAMAHILVGSAATVMNADSAMAQQMYRCGNAYSQSPCDKAAEPAKITRDSRSTPQPGLTGKELCKAVIPRAVPLKDPYSARVETIGEPFPEVIKVAGEPIMAQRYDVAMNAKNSFGAYTGSKLYLCYLSEDKTRLLHIVTPPNP